MTAPRRSERKVYDLARGNVEFESHQGSEPPGPPGAETFWVTSVEGSELLTLDWTVPDGEWTAVVMNADGSRRVATELAFGAKASNIGLIGWTRIAIGVIAVTGGMLAILYGVRHGFIPVSTSTGRVAGHPGDGTAQTP